MVLVVIAIFTILMLSLQRLGDCLFLLIRSNLLFYINFNILTKHCSEWRLKLDYTHLLYVTRGSKISKKGQNWFVEFLKNNRLDNITSMNKGP